MTPLKQKIKAALESNPDIDIVYTTSDERVFLTSPSAGNHSRGLADRKVTPYKRTDFEATAKLKQVLTDEEVQAEIDALLAKEEAEELAKKADEKAAKEAEDLAKKEAEEKALKKPNDKMTKDQLADWLNEQDVEFDLDDLKAVLLEKATTKYNELITLTEQ
ncbi:MAG: hypothetical protein RIC03_06975 [Cyclobacteriaceae bacterium]